MNINNNIKENIINEEEKEKNNDIIKDSNEQKNIEKNNDIEKNDNYDNSDSYDYKALYDDKNLGRFSLNEKICIINKLNVIVYGKIKKELLMELKAKKFENKILLIKSRYKTELILKRS